MEVKGVLIVSTTNIDDDFQKFNITPFFSITLLEGVDIYFNACYRIAEPDIIVALRCGR